MRAKRLRCVAAVVLFFATALPAAAQSATGEIDITVVDAGSQQPIGDARTILLGPQTASSLTTASGVIRYTDAPIGIYRVRVFKSGFQASSSAEFDVLPNRAVSVRVQLASSSTTPNPSATTDPNGLKVIATVVARSKVSITSTDISANSPQRRLSDSLTDALDKLAGVNVTNDATDPSSAVTISLHNQDESQTSLSLDGIPLGAPGSAGNLRSIGTDLFSGSSVSFGPSAGALGGGVSFRTLEPSQALQIRASGTTGTFDRNNYSIAATGSIGKLGIAVQHTWRGANSPLTFQEYLDQSGLYYPHEGYNHNLGDFLKMRYSLGDDRTSITATALTNNRWASNICARDVTVVPCGIGPSNESYGRYAFGYATITSLIGQVSTQFSGFSNAGTNDTNYAYRYLQDPLNGYEPGLFPELSNNATNARGVAYSASIAQQRHTFTLSGNIYSSVLTSTPITGNAFEVPFSNGATSVTYKFADVYKASDRWTITPQISLVNTTGVGTSAVGGIGGTLTPDPADAFTLSLNAGSSQPNLNSTQSFSDPENARFDCQARSAVVSAPGDLGGGSQSSFAINAAWSHQFKNGATFTGDAYSQVQSGQLINALIQEPLSIYPVGYLATLYSAYQAPLTCGTGAALPTVYASESVAGTRRLYQGFDLNARFSVGRNVVVIPSYTLQMAKLEAASNRLEDGPSTTIVGAQLPNRPMHRGGITIDGLLPSSGVELLANAQYTGSNNQQNIGPYIVVNAGISHKFGPGQLTLFENNMFNTYGGSFASDAFAQPLPLSNGSLLQTAGTPLTPRAFFLSYSTVIGGPAPGPAFASVATRGSARSIAQALPAQPAASPAPGQPRGGLRLQPFPPPPGADPLSLATSRPSCDASAQADAKEPIGKLRDYVLAYEAHQKLPEMKLVTITAHTTTVPGTAYYLEIRPNITRPVGTAGTAPGGPGGAPPGAPPGEGGGPGGPGGGPPGFGGPPPSGGASGGANRFANSPEFRAFRGFISCAYISVWTATEAKAKGIQVQAGRPGLYYVPGTGFVAVRPPELPQGGGSLKSTQ
jgi:hypothetical protein